MSGLICKYATGNKTICLIYLIFHQKYSTEKINIYIFAIK